MATWLEDITQALENLGGVASLQEIYEEVKRIRTVVPLPKHWKANIRGIIEDNSSDSAKFKGKDVFFSVKGLGKGTWGLRNYILSTPQASDIEDPPEPETQRVKMETYRVLRDTQLARTIKALHRNICQICGETVSLAGGKNYAETHHIKPLGKPHNGPDIPENILVLCPNHHVMCDYGAIKLDIAQLRTHPNHGIGAQFIAYHNTTIIRNH